MYSFIYLSFQLIEIGQRTYENLRGALLQLLYLQVMIFMHRYICVSREPRLYRFVFNARIDLSHSLRSVYQPMRVRGYP